MVKYKDLLALLPNVSLMAKTYIFISGMSHRTTIRRSTLVKLRKIRKASELTPNSKLAFNTLKTAKSNLKSSVGLYHIGNYPEAISLLQQSVEKGCKSFGYRFGIIDQSVVKKEIWHYGTRVFRKIIAYIQSNTRYIEKQFINLSKVLPELEENDGYDALLDSFAQQDKQTSKVIKFLEDMEKNRDDFANMPLKTMSEIIDKIDVELKEFEKNQANYDQYLEELVKKAEEEQKLIKSGDLVIGRGDSLVGIDGEKMEKTKEIFYNMAQNADVWFILNVFDCYTALYPLLILAIITQPHFETTRYPTDDKTPDDIYTLEHPIVQSFERISSIGINALDILDQVYTEMEKDESND